MRIRILLVAIILIYSGCWRWEIKPSLSSNYLQPIFSEIKKIDSGARVLNFVSDEEKFEFLDNVIRAGFFEVQDIRMKGDIISVTEYDYDLTGEEFADPLILENMSFTHYVFSGNKILEKHYKDSTEDKHHKAKYSMGLINEISTVYKKENDSVKFKFEYLKGVLINKKLFSSSGELFSTYNFNYKKNGNLDYMYSTDSEGDNYFDKFEWNNKKKQIIISRFDNDKKLIWLRYSEFNSLGLSTYEERHNKEYENSVFRKEKYTFNEYKEILSHDVLWSKSQSKSKFEYQYTKRDSLDNWIERRTLEDGKPFMITKRVIIYSNN